MIWVEVLQARAAFLRAPQEALVVKNPVCQSRRQKRCGLIPGWGRFPEGGSSNPLQYSCLENPMDRGAWWATVHGVPKSWTQLKRLGKHTLSSWTPITPHEKNWVLFFKYCWAKKDEGLKPELYQQNPQFPADSAWEISPWALGVVCDAALFSAMIDEMQCCSIV